MKKTSLIINLSAGLVLAPLLLGPAVTYAAGATGPHAVVMVCSSIGSSGTNLLTLYVQGISSDDPNVLAAVGPLTQPPPGVECGEALAKVMSLCASPKMKGGCAAGGGVGAVSNSSPVYTIQSAIPFDFSWVYTLTAP
jgi:hypothetical protein